MKIQASLKGEIKEVEYPVTFGRKLVIGNLESNVAICSLWSYPQFLSGEFQNPNTKQYISTAIDKNKVAIIGMLTSEHNGLSHMLRNCLANPKIRTIYILGEDKSPSKDALLKLKKNGVNADHIIIDTKGLKIHKEIPIDDINLWRENVEVIDLNSEMPNTSLDERVKEVNRRIDALNSKPAYCKPMIYEKPQEDTTSFPFEGTPYIARGKTVGETYLQILKGIMKFGCVTKMDDGDDFFVREVINMVSIVEEEDTLHPKLYPYFSFDEESIKKYYEEICNCNNSSAKEGCAYKYGELLSAYPNGDEKIDQIQEVIELLAKNPVKKNRLAITWQPGLELKRKKTNSPCIVLVHPLVQNGKIILTCYIRSNDMFEGWPKNAFGLRELQRRMAEGIGVKMGELVTISSSAQIYEKDWERAREILGEYDILKQEYNDPRGVYLISFEDGMIKVIKMHNGIELETLEGSNAKELSLKIAHSGASMDASHNLYLGRELVRAEMLREKYRQDYFD